MNDFSDTQKQYLEGLASGLTIARRVLGPGAIPTTAAAPPSGPDAIHLAAQDATISAGGKLADQEKWKRAEHPFESYTRLAAEARAAKAPKPEDNFRWRYHGLFYVAPTQDSYMCRLRLPNGIINHWQLAGLADLSDKYAGGFAHVTTRANLQIREIKPENGPDLLEGLQDLGLTARGSGADNIRNVTGSPTAGIDPQEILDTRPLARAWHFHILGDRTLTGLPRKFNVGFDGAGAIPVLEETNDIGFQAVTVDGEVWMRVVLGGITGHKDLARDTRVICRPDDCTIIADAIVRVFIENGDRTDRTKARLKYVLDRWGFDKFLAAVEDKLGRKLTRLPEGVEIAQPIRDRFGHVGVHAQKQDGKVWIGIVVPVGRLEGEQIRGIATLAREFGDGDIRLTVWQNLLLSGVDVAAVPEVQRRLAALGLTTEASSIRAGLVACTGNRGCKFAASDTKGHALQIADALDGTIAIDVPVNIHLTGCHHSCAQHYIGDIGLIGAKVAINDEGDTVEGYDIVVGGGFAGEASIGRDLWKGIKAEDCPGRIGKLLTAYLANRASPDESFHAFTNRCSIEELCALADQAGEA